MDLPFGCSLSQILKQANTGGLLVKAIHASAVIFNNVKCGDGDKLIIADNTGTFAVMDNTYCNLILKFAWLLRTAT